MSAQEEERRRIARDLHDDANQELAALSIALSALGSRLPPDSAPGLREEVARLQARAVALAEGIRHLSHELHPGVLQHVGVAVALRSYCREFTRTHGLPVMFRAEGDQGVHYDKGTWHHFLLVLDPDSDFLVVDRAGPGDNCDEVALGDGEEIRVRR